MINSWEKLSGGNLTSAYRQNETVLREQKAWSPTIHFNPEKAYIY
ncbi:hypothetical protein [Clostridium chromiireducens]|nr:hypothetical protein [Clostridium chromiireducens]